MEVLEAKASFKEDKSEMYYARIERMLTEKLERHQHVVERIISKALEQGFDGEDKWRQNYPTESYQHVQSADCASAFAQIKDASGVGSVTFEEQGSAYGEAPQPKKQVEFTPPSTKNHQEVGCEEIDYRTSTAQREADLLEQENFREQKFDAWMFEKLDSMYKDAHKRRKDYGVRCCIRVVRFHILETIVDSHLFDMLSMLVILANSVYIGYRSNEEIRCVVDNYMQGTADSCFDLQLTWRDLGFTFFFTIELILRLAAMQGLFFVGEDWSWNLFDMCLVLTALIDTLGYFGNAQFTQLRMLRLLRMLRGAKVIRVVRFFSTFRMMLHEFMHSLLPLMWATLFILMLTYVFSLLILQGIIEEAPKMDKASMTQLLRFFDSVPKSILSLYMSVTGGVSWIEMSEPLLKMSTFHVLMFVQYVTLVVLVAFNVITATFVNEAEQAQEEEDVENAHGDMLKTRALVKKYRHVFHHLDKNQSGLISRDEFHRYSENEQVRAFFEEMEIDTDDLDELFDLLDEDDTGYLELDEFFSGCANIKGMAKAANVEALMRENKRLLKKLGKEMDTIREALRELKGRIWSKKAATRNGGEVTALASETLQGPTRRKAPAPLAARTARPNQQHAKTDKANNGIGSTESSRETE